MKSEPTPSFHPERVVVGLKPGGLSREALEWALAHFAPRASVLRVHVQEHSDEAPLSAAQSGAEGEWVIRTGRPATELIEVARSSAADLVVLGPHERDHHLSESFQSSAEELAHHLSVPILIVKAPPSGPPRRLLVPVGSRGIGEREAHWVDELGRRFGAEIVAVHVEDLTEPLHPDQEAFQQAYLAGIKKRLEERLAGLGLAPERLHLRLVRGEPCPGILDSVHETGADLLVLGSHGPGVLERFLSPGVAGRVLRSAPCSLFLVPERDKAGA